MVRKVIVVGAGFAGLALARFLDDALVRRGDPIDITLVSPSPHAVISPLVPGIVGGWVQPAHAIVPLLPLLRRLRVVVGRAISFDPSARTLEVLSGNSATMSYDDLVLATGRVSRPDPILSSDSLLWMRNAQHAIGLRARLRDAVEAAANEPSARRRRALLTVAIVGGSLMACSTALEVKRHLLSTVGAYPMIDPSDVRVVVVAEGSRLAEDLPEACAQAVTAALTTHRIQTLPRSRATEVRNDHLRIEGETEKIDTRTVVWMTDLGPSSVVQASSVRVRDDGRLSVRDDMRVEGIEGVYAIGDSASTALPDLLGVTPARLMMQVVRITDALGLGKHHFGKGQRRRVPLVDPVLIDRDNGWCRFPGVEFVGSAGAWMARVALLGHVPPASRAAVAAAWTADALFPSEAMVPELRMPPTPPLYLTATPGAVRERDHG